MAKAKKLPSGQWRALVYDYTDSAGKRHYESFTADTKKEAEYLAAEFAMTKKERIKNNQTVAEAIDMYIEHRTNILSPASIRGYKQMYKYYGELSDIRLKNLKQKDVELWVNGFSKTHSPKTVRNAYGLLKSVLAEYAPSLTINIKMPQKIKPTYHVPNDNEIKKIISYYKEHDNDMLIAVYLAAFGTMRRSEICGLTAGDVSGDIIHIRGIIDDYSQRYNSVANDYFENMQHEMQHENEKPR